MCHNVAAHLDGGEVARNLVQTLLVVDDEEDRVVLVDPLVRERRHCRRGRSVSDLQYGLDGGSVLTDDDGAEHAECMVDEGGAELHR